MPRKSLSYALYEAIQGEMLRDETVAFLYEYQTPVVSFGTLPAINLSTKFGFPRVAYAGIVENWYAAAAFGAARVGVKVVADIPSMASCIVFHWLATCAKLRYNSGGKESFPLVIIIEQPERRGGAGITHADYEADGWLMRIPGLKTVEPSTAYDAKGLMIAAIRSPDPIAYIWGMGLRPVADEVPDEPYEVPIGQAAVRTEGTDITIVSHGQAMVGVLDAATRLKKEGVSVETIDLRTLQPMDTRTLVESARKTGRLLTVDHSCYTLCAGSEVAARVAEGVPGVKIKRIAFPDAPGPGAPEMMEWMVPNANRVYEAAKWLLAR